MRHELERPRRTAVILDPHQLCHTAIRTLLAQINVELVGATRSIWTAHTLLREHRPNLLVLEVDLPNAREEALRLIERACAEDPHLTVVVLSATDERLLIDAAFDRGAQAYVLKSSDTEDIVTAISQAFEPSLYLSRPGNGKAAAPTLDGVLMRKLTRREIEILRLVSGGRSNRQVAEILFVTDQTVKFHLANVYRKLGVRSRFEAARWASEQGLIDLSGTPNVVALPEISSVGHEGNGVLVPLRQTASAQSVATGAGETSL
jgi:DNA-binding NarL/FixJ family response regulator